MKPLGYPAKPLLLSPPLRSPPLRYPSPPPLPPPPPPLPSLLPSLIHSGGEGLRRSAAGSGTSIARLAPRRRRRRLMYRFFSRRKNCPSRWAAPLRREPLYAASCLAFCLLGGWTVRHAAAVHAWLAAAAGGWPYFSERMLVVHGGAAVLQGVLSFGSDVLLVGKPSLLHLADRALAVVLTLLGVYIEGMVLLCGRLSFPLQALMAGLLCASLAHHFRAKAAIRDQVYHTYVWSHTLWHLGVCASFPIPMTLAIGPRVLLGLE